MYYKKFPLPNGMQGERYRWGKGEKRGEGGLFFLYPCANVHSLLSFFRPTQKQGSVSLISSPPSFPILLHSLLTSSRTMMLTNARCMKYYDQSTTTILRSYTKASPLYFEHALQRVCVVISFVSLSLSLSLDDCISGLLIYFSFCIYFSHYYDSSFSSFMH